MVTSSKQKHGKNNGPSFCEERKMLQVTAKGANRPGCTKMQKKTQGLMYVPPISFNCRQK
jgi:hypothetical protein